MVCMAGSLTTIVTPELFHDHMQKHDNNKETASEFSSRCFDNTNLCTVPSGHQMMGSEDSATFMRPRSFSDVSISSGGRGFFGKLQEKLEHGSSMKVIMCRETEVISGPDKGRKVLQEAVTVPEKDQGRPSSGRSRGQLTRSKSVKGRSDLPLRDSDGVPPPKPKLPENYRHYFSQQLQHQRQSASAVSVKTSSHHNDHHQQQQQQQQRPTNPGILGGSQPSDTQTRPKSKSVSFAESPLKDYRARSASNLRTGSSRVDSGSSSTDRQFRSEATGSGTRQFSVLYRHHDAQYQSELLRQELNRLRTSEYVRKNSETVRKRLSSSDLTKPGDSPVKFALDMPGLVDEAFIEVKKSDIRTVHSHAVSKPVLRQTKTFDQRSVEKKTQIPYLPSGAFPPSGASTEDSGRRARDDSFVKTAQSGQDPKSLKPRRTLSQKGSAQVRSKSETVTYRTSNNSIDQIDRGRKSGRNADMAQQAVLERPKSPSNLRRKQDTIRRFNNSSFQPKREKVRREFHQSHKGAKGGTESSSDNEDNDAKTKPVGEVDKRSDQNLTRSVAGGTRIERAIGDNRSDEEKYAALSWNKIVHAKSSSVDSQLAKPKESESKWSVIDQLRELLTDPISAHINLAIDSSGEKTEVGKAGSSIKSEIAPALPPKTKSIISESHSFSSTESLEKFYLKENKVSKSDKNISDLPFSDSECVVNKGAKQSSRSVNPSSSSLLSSVTSSSQGKVVLRQCVIGSDVAFSLVGVQAGALSRKPNGNGYLDGQGLVTIRMIPDEQGRFGFNVKGGADQGMPIIVSRVAPNTPADNAIPRLNEGDQVLFINGRDVSQHTHEQVVMFIRASRETHSGELVLKVRPNAHSGDENSDEPDLTYDPETHQISSVTSGANALDLSLKLLEESLDSGAALAQFDQLYRKKPGMTMNAARLEANIPKNRYRDISPYDQTRVIMKNAVNGDYINANYVNMEIPVSGIVNRYIAAQGPLPTTCADFWNMIWEQQSTLVVMLTTKVERGRIKCHQYWPDLYTTTDHGQLQITCVKEEETDSFAFREFNLTHVELQEERHISHMQYIAWPDHGVPEDPADFLEFVIKVRQKRVGLVEPSIVHCSAGIGRTGVLITMETAMCLIEANQPVYPLSIVRQMRDQRAMLIQTANQYKFVCEAILRCFNEGVVKPLPEYQQR